MSRLPYSAQYGPWALITGAAMGLGAEFSRQLAARVLNIVLADINVDILHTTNEAIGAQTGVQTHPLPSSRSMLQSFPGKASTELAACLSHFFPPE
jgi:NADP-dependent 3-hydroxy acid dehydrogenase YdfG